MGVRIFNGDGSADSRGSILYDSVSGWAFGPIFDSQDDVESFLWTLDDDARALTDSEFRLAYAKWLDKRQDTP